MDRAMRNNPHDQEIEGTLREIEFVCGTHTCNFYIYTRTCRRSRYLIERSADHFMNDFLRLVGVCRNGLRLIGWAVYDQAQVCPGNPSPLLRFSLGRLALGLWLDQCDLSCRRFL